MKNYLINCRSNLRNLPESIEISLKNKKKLDENPRSQTYDFSSTDFFEPQLTKPGFFDFDQTFESFKQLDQAPNYFKEYRTSLNSSQRRDTNNTIDINSNESHKKFIS